MPNARTVFVLVYIAFVAIMAWTCPTETPGWFAYLVGVFSGAMIVNALHRMPRSKSDACHGASPMPNAKRVQRGYAGHLIVGYLCRFHIATEIGDVLVSTVGAYFPTGKSDEMETVGSNRLFETMAFRLGADVCGCGCGERQPSDWGEIDFEGYNDAPSAAAGHEAMCIKWESKSDA